MGEQIYHLHFSITQMFEALYFLKLCLVQFSMILLLIKYIKRSYSPFLISGQCPVWNSNLELTLTSGDKNAFHNHQRKLKEDSQCIWGDRPCKEQSKSRLVEGIIPRPRTIKDCLISPWGQFVTPGPSKFEQFLSVAW